MPIVQIQQVSFCECVNVALLPQLTNLVPFHLSLSLESGREREIAFFIVLRLWRVCAMLSVCGAAHTQLK